MARRLAVAILLLALADRTSKADQVPGITPVQEAALGERALALFFEEHELGEDAALAERVRRIGAALAAVGDRPQIVYRFFTIAGEERNAFSFPAGAICIPEGMVRLYEKSEDELAFVLAHEIAHVTLRHHVERIRLQVTLAGDPLESDLVKGITARLDQGAETEADRYGALYLVRAGYRYTAAPEAIERLARSAPGPQGDDEHSNYSERITALRDLRQEFDRSLESFSLGSEALNTGRASDAVTYFGLFVAQFPSSLAGRVNLGSAYLTSVRTRSGTVGGLAETMPFLPEADVVLRSSIDRGEVDLARRQFAAALALEPESIEAAAGLALAEMRLGRLDQAKRRLEQALEARPTDAALSLCLGNVEYLAGRFESATGHYDRALTLRADWPEAMKNLALVAERRGETERARVLWGKIEREGRLAKEAHERLAALDDESRRPTALLSDEVGNSRTEDPARAPLSFVDSEPEGDAPTSSPSRGIGGLAPVASAARDPAEIGRALLRLGDRTRAVAALESASELRPEDPRVWGDLSAALLARAEADDRPEDLFAALAAADRGYRLDPGRTEVAFNRALALERLYLEPAALEAWRDLESKAAPGSLASRDAQERIDRRSRDRSRDEPIDSGALQAVGEGGRALEILVAAERPALARWIRERVIRRWAEGKLTPNDPLWAAARKVAASIAQALGDRAPLDALATVDSTQNPVALRKALGLYFVAMDHRARDAGAAEAAALVEMRNVCPLPCRPFAEEAGLRLAIHDYLVPDYDAAEVRLKPLVETGRLGYLSLAGESHWLLGLILTRGSRLDEARNHYAQAHDLLERAGERGRVVQLYLRRSGLERMLGNRREQWRDWYRSLAGMHLVAESRERGHILFVGGLAVQEAGYPHAAAYFQDGAVALARAGGDPADIQHASLFRALVRHELGDADGAREDLGEAARQLRDIPAGSLRGSLEAEQCAIEGQVRRVEEPSAALGLLDRALDYFRVGKSDDRRATLLLDRGLALEALGKLREAEADLLAGIEGYERHRRGLSEPSSISYFDRSGELFDAMVRLQIVRRGNPVAAWEFAERSRGRRLLDSMTATAQAPAQTLALDAIRKELPPASALVSYTVLEDRLIAWVVTREGLEQTVTPVPAKRLSRLVANLLALADPGSGVPYPLERAQELYDLLLRPIEGFLKGATQLLVVPDGPVHRVPFAALSDSRTGRFVVEDRAVSVVPSATVLVHSMRRAAGASGPPRLLAIGDPEFSSLEFPELGLLPGARIEARRIAAHYADSRLLLGPQATRQAFLDLAGTREVVHLAGHALEDLELPQNSRLALAPDRGGNGALSSRDLYGIALPRTRLVVLAACSTASGKVSRGEGALSLARPFLAAGVPSVVASLWSIDDAASTVLFERFHEEWLSGKSVSDALRAAQLDLLASPDPNLASPAAWAAIELFGSPTLSVRMGGTPNEKLGAVAEPVLTARVERGS